MIRATAAAIALAAALATPAAADPVAALARDLPRCPAATRCVALRVHVAVTADGPVASAAWLAGQLATAHALYAPLATAFEVTAVAPLPAAAAHVATRRARTALGHALSPTAIDVFVTARLDDVDVPGEQRFGVAWRRAGRKYVILSTAGPSRVLAHELGHVFGLPHSSYPESIMNKAPREQPPPEARRFADPELAILRRSLARYRVRRDSR